MLKKTLKHLKGFTLVELLVVIAIIAVLSSIGVVSFRGARQRADDSKMLADIRTIQSGVELYTANNSGLPGSQTTISSFNDLLVAINVTSGLLPPTNDNKAYCYFEDTNDSEIDPTPTYLIAATGLNTDVDQGYTTALTTAGYETNVGGGGTTGVAECAAANFLCDDASPNNVTGRFIACLGN